MGSNYTGDWGESCKKFNWMTSQISATTVWGWEGLCLANWPKSGTLPSVHVSAIESLYILEFSSI